MGLARVTCDACYSSCVGFGAAWFTAQQGKASDRENTDNQRETVLQAYIDKMSELLLEKHLRESQPEDEVRKIARLRTITILFQLDARRIGLVFAFLSEAGLMSTIPNSSIISLRGANLSKIDWSQFDLSQAQLAGANLSGANLVEANLVEAQLNGTQLNGADLRGADLSGADLTGIDTLYEPAQLNGADLRGADLSGADLRGAKLNGADLRGAKLIGLWKRDTSSCVTNLSGADLREADLSKAKLMGIGTDLVDDLSEAKRMRIWDGYPLSRTDLREVKGLTKERLEGCKAMGAIIDEAPTTSSS